MSKFEIVKKWAEDNGFDWRSAYGHYTKRIITHNSTPPCILEPEEMEHIYDLAQSEVTKALDSYADKADSEYSWSEVDNWIFAFGDTARNDLIRRRQLATPTTNNPQEGKKE